MARKLLRMKVDRIDLVDKGANQQAHIVLVKRAVQKDSPTLSSVHVDVPGDERDEYEKALLSSEARNSLPDSAFAAVWTDSSGKKQRKLPYRRADGSLDAGHHTAALGRIDGADIPADVKARARRKLEGAKKVGKTKDLLKSILGLHSITDEAQRKTELERLTKAVEDGDEDDKKPDDKKDDKKDDMSKREAEVNKSLADLKKANDDLVAANAALKKQHDDALAVIKGEQAIRKRVDMSAILKSFKATPFNVDLTNDKNDVDRFIKMQDSDPELFNRTMELLKATDAQLAASDLFKMHGSAMSTPGSAWAQIEAKAEQLITKSASPLTREAALDRVMMENPKLVAQYRAEQQ